tara:strand:+ start:3334 stop:3795 length:462 start_codon:yes stop_codon:yes gene_type:complete
MSLGTKIRSAVNAVGSKSKSIGRIGHKAGKFVGKFDKSAGAELNELADDSAMAGSVAKDIGHIGTTTGLFQKGGMVASKQGIMGTNRSARSQTSASPFTGPVARTGLTHLATAGLGAGAKLLAQPHEQLRRRDIIAEGGRLSRQARSHLKSFR